MTSFQLPFSTIVELEGDLRLVQPVRREVAVRALEERLDRRRLVGEADVDDARRLHAGDRLQPVLRGVELRPHVPGVEQAPVELVGPLVVRADELRRRPLVRGADAAAAMAAGVVEGADRSVGPAHDDDRVLADLHRHEVAGLRDLAGRDREQPVAIPDRLNVEPEDLRIRVERTRQGVPGSPGTDQVQHVGTNIHGVLPSGPHTFPGCDSIAPSRPATASSVSPHDAAWLPPLLLGHVADRRKSFGSSRPRAVAL